MDKKVIAAWEISYEIMSRTEEPLLLTVLHPGGGQYECLTTMRNTESPDYSSFMMINLNGSSINCGNGNDLLRPYPELYQENKEALINEIARRCHFSLSEKAVRPLYALKFFINLLKEDRKGLLHVTAAWYDSPDSCKLSQTAKDFKYYVNRNSEERARHLMWWTVCLGSCAVAMCNFKTDELIAYGGECFQLPSDARTAAQVIRQGTFIEQVRASAFESKALSQSHPEWRNRYAAYAKDILKNSENIQKIRRSLREWRPLFYYINISNAKKRRGSIKFEMRYLGQNVADLSFLKTGEILLDTSKYDETNERDFGCDIRLHRVKWVGQEAKTFRSFFKTAPSKKGHGEHRVQSLLFDEFEKTASELKALKGIQPVEVQKVRFPMPTPIRASDHKALDYSDFHGGGIDILARAGRGRKTNLCVIELKDENKKAEPPVDVLKQAAAYAAFIRELLRSESGADWWRLFGFMGDLPQKLILFTVCAMPAGDNGNELFASAEINIGDDMFPDDAIVLHDLCFTEQDNRITDIKSSLNR